MCMLPLCVILPVVSIYTRSISTNCSITFQNTHVNRRHGLQERGTPGRQNETTRKMERPAPPVDLSLRGQTIRTPTPHVKMQCLPNSAELRPRGLTVLSLSSPQGSLGQWCPWH